MRKLLIIIFLFIHVISCKQDSKKGDGVALHYPSDSNAQYFPIKTNNRFVFNNRELALDTMLNTRFSHTLFISDEPILSKYAGNQDIYRFTYLRSFDNPIVIRIQNIGDSIVLITKSLETKSEGYGKIIYNITKQLTVNEWKRYVSLLRKADYWKLDPMTNPKEWSTDGSLWILEGVKDGKYRFVVRRSQKEDYDFGRACRFLLDLSDIQIEGEDIY